MLLVYLQQGNVKNSKILMKIVNIDKGSLDIFQKTLGISVKFSRRMCLITILNIAKNQAFTFSLENAVFEKSQGGQIDR